MNDSDVVKAAPAIVAKAPTFIPRRPIIAVDLDNVCFHYTQSLRPFALDWIRTHQHRDIVLDDLIVEPGWNAPEWGLRPDEFAEVKRYAAERGMFAVALPMPGAASTLRALSAAGYEIRYVTARLLSGDIAEHTERSLRAHGFPDGDVLFVGEHFGSTEKSMVQADIFIDDSVRNIEAFQERGIPCIVFDHVYNRGLGDASRARSWREVIALVEEFVGPALVPPDRSFELIELEAQCAALALELDRTIVAIGELRGLPVGKSRTRDIRAAIEANRDRITNLERTKDRLDRQLETAESRCAALREQVLRRDEFLRLHPEFIQEVPRREIERESRRLRQERQALEELRSDNLAERERLHLLRADIERKSDELREEALALDVERCALGLPLRDQPLLNLDSGFPTMHVSYGRHVARRPEISILLGSAIAQPVAELEVEELGYRILGTKVDAIFSRSCTDIDILAMRGGLEGDLLNRDRTEILSQLATLGPDRASHRARMEHDLRQIERQLFLTVEVKWLDGSLSKSQQELYDTLVRGGTVTLRKDLPDLGEQSGLGREVSFASDVRIIRVGPRDWAARREGQTIRSVRESQSAEPLGTPASDAPELAARFEPRSSR